MTTPTLRLVNDDTAEAIETPSLDLYRGRLFLTVADVARLTDTDPRTVRRAIEDGQIPAIHIATTIRIPAAPFWLLCGLDPTQNEAGPTGPGLDDSIPGEGRADDHHDPRSPG